VSAPRIHPGDFTSPCSKCTAVNGAHSLRCPTVNLSPGWYERILEEEEKKERILAPWDAW
jgi:hypothetical protein